MAGAVGEKPSRTYGEAIVTGQRAGAEGLGERRCIGENRNQGAKHTGGLRGVVPPGKHSLTECR